MNADFFTQLMQILLTGCGALITIAGAAAIVYNIYKAFKQPNSERDKMMKEHERKLENCSSRLDNVEGGMAVLLQSNLAIMNHLIDGDHLEELKRATNDLQDYLIGQKTDMLKK